MLFPVEIGIWRWTCIIDVKVTNGLFYMMDDDEGWVAKNGSLIQIRICTSNVNMT